tara:strand:- start:4426 stop:4584 length:159 start_codon:yes stop_codon:yes gene_type:complete
MNKYYVEIESYVSVVVDADSEEQAEEIAMSKNFKGEKELLLNKVVCISLENK